MVNFRKAFTYIFDDEQWFEKLIIPLLVSFIPLVGQFAMLGYVLRTINNVHQNLVNPLPSFDFGEDLSRGFRYSLVTLVYSLPAFLLALIFALLSNVMNSNSNPGTEFIGIMLMFLFVSLIFVYSIALVLIQPLIMANFAVKNTFASGFEFGNFFRLLRKNFSAWLLVYAGQILTALIAPFGIILLFVGVAVTGFYGQLFIAHLTGQAMIASE